MPWWNPITWFNGQLVSTTDMNQQIRDNLRFLKGLDGPTHIENAIDIDRIPAPTAPPATRTRVYADSATGLLMGRTSTDTHGITQFAARVTRSTEQTIQGSTLTDLIFNSAPLNRGGMWSLSSPADIIIPVSGVYLAGLNLLFLNYVGVVYTARVSVSGLTVGQTRFIGTNGGGHVTLSGTTAFAASAGDNVRFAVWHNHSAALNALVVTEISPVAWVVGPF